MAFSLDPGPRGPVPRWNGLALASAYDPDREARTWAAAVSASPGALVFVAGDPGGAGPALAERGYRPVSLLPDAAARSRLSPAPAWAPQDGPLEDFLTTELDTWGADAVVWEVWPAFERAAPEMVSDWSRRFRDVYRAVQGSWLTQTRFGPRFWHNAVRNAVRWERPVHLVQGTRPIVVAASGPSLDDGLAHLARGRSQFDLWALPSSFETLVQRGLLPDAGIATDGGFYAREHLQRLTGTAVPVLAALGSAPDGELERRPCLFFGQGLGVEDALLDALAPDSPRVSSQGTVAVTALRLALEATTGPVFVAGLDLAFRDVRGHTSPHTVDRRFDGHHSRLSPRETLWSSRLYEQATVVHEGERTSPAMVTYARWLASHNPFSRTVYRVAPTGVRWSSMREVTWDEAQSLWRSGGRPAQWQAVDRWPGTRERIAAVRAVLEGLTARIAACAGDDPWLIELARTAVPRALAEDLKARRAGDGLHRAQTALREFLPSLGKELE